MSFVLDLRLPPASAEAVRPLVARTAAPDLLQVGAGPAGISRRWRSWIADELADGEPILNDEAPGGQAAFTLTLGGAAALAETVLVIAEHVGAGWSLRAFWVGDRLRAEQDVVVQDLSALCRLSGLRRDTRYRVVAA